MSKLSDGERTFDMGQEISRMASTDTTLTPANEPLANPHNETRPTYSLGQITRYALYLGTFGFGGPVALVGYMHRDLVERRKWISEADYKEGLTLSQIMPGPLAAQLAIYLGYVHYGLSGATWAGTAFVLPSFLMVVALGVYVWVVLQALRMSPRQGRMRQMT